MNAEFMKTAIESIFIPNICRNSNVLRVVVLVELLALVISLGIHERNFVVHLGTLSLYLQWWALSALALLCWLRRVVGSLPRFLGSVIVIMLIMTPFVLIELFFQHYFGSLDRDFWFDTFRFWRFFICALILSLVFLRIMLLAGEIDSWNKAEAESRIQALQSRIQPHFLFNSLNTISELAATDADKAEDAIQALSMLFRVSLEENSNMHSLQKELKLCQRYLELEMWRVGDQISIDWGISISQPELCQVPKLILQPLVENAIKYGVEPSLSNDGPVDIEISVKETQKDISIKVRNPIADLPLDSIRGNGIAIKNIRERLFVLYDDNHSFKINSSNGYYQVLMKLPK